MSVLSVRAFVSRCSLLITNKQFATKLAESERKLLVDDSKFEVVFEAIRDLISPPPEKQTKRTGFRNEESCLR